MPYKIPQLPLDFDLETKAIMKKTAASCSALAELKGAALSIAKVYYYQYACLIESQ